MTSYRDARFEIIGDAGDEVPCCYALFLVKPPIEVRNLVDAFSLLSNSLRGVFSEAPFAVAIAKAMAQQQGLGTIRWAQPDEDEQSADPADNAVMAMGKAVRRGTSTGVFLVVRTPLLATDSFAQQLAEGAS